MPRRNKRVVRRRRPRRKRMTARRRAKMSSMKNVISLGGRYFPKTAFAKHKYTRQIRIPNNYELPAINEMGSTAPPLTLKISANSMTSIMNEEASVGFATQVPAFLGGSGTFSNNRWPRYVEYLQRMYSQYTVVGSKVTIRYQPFRSQVQSADVRVVPTPITFVLLKKSSPSTVGFSGNVFNGSTLPDKPMEQPGAKTKTWSQLQAYAQKPVTMSHTFSARKEYGKGKGNVVGESNLQVAANVPATGTGAPPFPYLALDSAGGAVYPKEQTYYNWIIMPGISEVTLPAVPSFLPAGMIQVDVEYSTVWSEPSYLLNT